MTVISRNMSDSEYICTAHVLQGKFFSEITISSLKNPDFKQNNFHNGCDSFLLNPDLVVNFFRFVILSGRNLKRTTL